MTFASEIAIGTCVLEAFQTPFFDQFGLLEIYLVLLLSLLCQTLIFLLFALSRILKLLSSFLVFPDLELMIGLHVFLHSFLALKLFHEHVLNLLLLRLCVLIFAIHDKFPTPLLLALL